jgi:hypothetical protein
MAAVLARFVDPWPAELAYPQRWDNIILELDKEIAKLAPGYRLNQIKEKFGELRFYYEYGSIPSGVEDKVAFLISMAEVDCSAKSSPAKL